MAFSFTSHALFAKDKTAGSSYTTLATELTQPVAVGKIFFVIIAKNNASTVDGETSEVTNVTDSKGNTYTKVKEFTNGQGSAADGATVAVWMSQITTALVASTDTLTFSFSSSVVAKAAVGLVMTVGAGSTVELVASDVLAADNAQPGSIDLTVPNSEHLWLRGVAHERPGPGVDSMGKTAAYTNFSYDGTTGGATVSNMTAGQEWDIFTGTSNASSPSWSTNADHASVLLAFREVVAAGSAAGAWRGKGGWW